MSKAAVIFLIASFFFAIGCSQTTEPSVINKDHESKFIDGECYQAFVSTGSISVMVDGPDARCPWGVKPVKAYRRWQSKHGDCWDASVDTTIGYVYACHK